MNGKINFDLSNDMDVLEMCRFINEHQHLHIETEYNGRFVELSFTTRPTTTNEEAKS